MGIGGAAGLQTFKYAAAEPDYMKIMMVEGRYRGEIDLSNLDSDALPKKIGLVTTVQFLGFLENVKDYLESRGKVVLTDRMRQKYDGQLLGCDSGSAEKLNESVDALLYIGTGIFHPFGAALNTDKDVFCYDPISAVLSKIDRQSVENNLKKRKSAWIKFLSSENVGVLVSLKPGQNNFKKLEKLKMMFNDKKYYVFAFDTLDFFQLENFPFVQCWVNTACSRIMDDYEKFGKPLIDLDSIEKNYLIAVAVK